MKNNIFKIFLPALALVFFASCGGSENTGSTEEATEKVAENCTYKMHSDSMKVGWTAYKFTNKVGVNGSFEQFDFKSAKEASDIASLIENSTIYVPIASLETQNEDRNAKIMNFFFGSLENSSTLKGKVVSVSKEEAGKGIMALVMNNQEVEMPFTYTLSDKGELVVSTTIDVNNWNAQSGITSLNEECKLLHTGEDGISKLWPNVDITISTFVEIVCN